MENVHETECCPRFDPSPWDEKELVWQDRLFIKDRVRSFLHIPLNFGAVMQRNFGPIQAAGAFSKNMIVMADENSLWGADVYLEITKEVPGANMTKISGTFLSKIFEGPYKNMRHWIQDMQRFVESKGKKAQKLYFYYTTCPKCAKLYGKNYVVILAQI